MNLYMNKFLICQPMGGINDMLCQIGECISYAETYHRTLIIDTSLSDLNDKFDNYFLPNDLGRNIKLNLDENLISMFYEDVKNDDYKLVGNSLNPISVPLKHNLPYKFLLHRSFGGGYMSFLALQYFKLEPTLSEKIKQKKRQLGDYHAVMIRHRDYNTNYKQALNAIEKLNIDLPLFLFTDNHVVQDYAKTLKFKKLLINENLYKSNESDLSIMHVYRKDPNISSYEINCQVLFDLFLAAMSNHIYPTFIQGHHGDNQFDNLNIKSGFINLAIELQTNKDLLKNLLC